MEMLLQGEQDTDTFFLSTPCILYSSYFSF